MLGMVGLLDGMDEFGLMDEKGDLDLFEDGMIRPREMDGWMIGVFILIPCGKLHVEKGRVG